MTSETDPLCGCPVETFAANRRDRRDRAKRGLTPTAVVTRHRRDCPRRGASARRSDPANDKLRGLR